jgi:serine/threonine-protein kinase
MGVVYKARHRQLKRLVALKMVLAAVHTSSAQRQRFLREAEAVAQLQHPHIVQIFEIGQHDGLPFVSLELVEGGNLADKLRDTPLPPREAAKLVEQLARGVAYAHGRGVIHRDLKPANVLLTPDGTPKITDFGLAKRVDADPALTAPGSIVGTPYYMSPEQASGANPVGPATDIYSLGAILYEALTGQPPFKATTSFATLDLVRSQEPVPPRRLQPRTPRDLETICLKCLHKDPDRRYPSAETLADDLRRFQAGETIQARPVGRLERLVKWIRRNPAGAALAALLLAFAVLLLLWLRK